MFLIYLFCVFLLPFSVQLAKGQAADFGDVQRELSSRWKELSPENADRSKFERMAADDRARFAQQSAAKDREVRYKVSDV